jgi:hypothetical protein
MVEAAVKETKNMVEILPEVHPLADHGIISYHEYCRILIA